MFMPSGELFIIKDNGEKESIMIVDFSSRKEMLDEVKWYVNYMIKHNKTEYKNWVSMSYERNNNVIYTDTIDNCLKEEL